MWRRASTSPSWELRLPFLAGPAGHSVASAVVGVDPSGPGRWPVFPSVDASWCGTATPVEMGIMISESLVRRLVIDLCRRPGSCCR